MRFLSHILLPALVVAAALGAGSAGPAAGQVLFQGLVTDEGGTPIAEVDLDFYDPATGVKVDPFPPDMPDQDDNTDATGHFSVVVRPEVYDVRFAPPVPRTDLAPRMVRDVVLGYPTTLDATLPYGVRLTGTVRGPGGSPVAGVDLDLADTATGARAEMVRDDTAADGSFAVTVVPGIYDVIFDPPVGSGVAGLRVERFRLMTSGALHVTLEPGYQLHGLVQDGAGTPLIGVDLDAIDRASGESVPMPGDKTGFDGSFSAVLPAGTFDLFVVPPPIFGLAARALHGFVLSGDSTLAPLVLAHGVLVSGTVLGPDSVTTLAQANLDLFLAGSELRMPLSPGRTGAAGDFQFRVEAGTYDLLVDVPDSPLAPQWFRALPLAADTTMTLVFPPTGPTRVEIVSSVRDPEGTAVAGALVRGTPAAEGEIWEVTTGFDGALSVFVLPGTYRLDVAPPSGTDLLPLTLDAVEVPDAVPPILALERRPPPPQAALALLSHPSRLAASIRLVLPAEEPSASLQVFDLTGRRVATLLQGPLPAGDTEIVWHGDTDDGGSAHPGIYFLRFAAAGSEMHRKILWLP